jgi:hypothetical protein
MKLVHRSLLLLLLVFSIAFLFEECLPLPAFAAATTPNKLVIARTPGINNSGTSSQEVVLSAGLVQKLYQHTLSLPVAPASQICPQYLIANYQLTFLHNQASILHVKAVNGLCGPVALSQKDVRTADGTFWNLLNQAQIIGIK